MRLTALTLVMVGVIIGSERAALGRGGNLDKPSIAMTDPVAEKIAGVLRSHAEVFTGGWYINAHSELYFAGGAKGVNALLSDLAHVEGSTVLVRLSKEAGVTHIEFPTGGGRNESPCDCKIDHNGWTHPDAVTLTIYLGGGRIDPSELELPAIAGLTPQKGK